MATEDPSQDENPALNGWKEFVRIIVSGNG
jgi:hypothetical protein